MHWKGQAAPHRVLGTVARLAIRGIMVGTRPYWTRPGELPVPAGATKRDVMAQLSDRNLAGLLAVRNHLARFQRTSDREARGLGTTHAQQHVLLALRGHRYPDGPTVKDVATALGVASPSAVELIARMVGAKLIERHSDPGDARITRLRLTPLGERLMHQLSQAHLPRLREMATRAVEHLTD